MLGLGNKFSYITDNNPLNEDKSKSEGLYVEEAMDVIAKQPYILIEEPEVVVMNTQTDDILFEIMTKSRTSDDLMNVYRNSRDNMNSL